MPRPRELIACYWGVGPAIAVVALLALRACLVTAPLDRLALAPAPSDPRDPPGTVAREGSRLVARGGPV
ncbi:MAG TPA: hypothetical protein VFS15_18210, partial [Kofleriaceae bacterium]|nr:hypothetical protein [Kofleriaceae bacterium]